MGKITLVVSALLLLALVEPASAQQSQWVRIQLNDGRVVDGQLTGGDAQNHFVQTPHGYFSILKTNVVSITPMQTGNVAPAPPPPPMPMSSGPTPVAAPEGGGSNRFGHGVRFALGTYLLTAIIAATCTKKDDDAKMGFIPIAGPLLWTLKNDEDDAFEDGWDWLAFTSTAGQVAGLFGLVGNKKSGSSWLSVSPVGARNYGGVAAVGTF